MSAVPLFRQVAADIGGEVDAIGLSGDLRTSAVERGDAISVFAFWTEAGAYQATRKARQVFVETLADANSR
ncbi:hypothetical protein [Lentisalinibacter sediminis]|uniref:hypothetical protein n=1 Tax=Lentisalinibacter sediminis TaxID=2992237 RepID=UPI00386F7493